MGVVRNSVKRRQMQLAQWGEKLADLVAEAEVAGAEATNEYLDSLQDLKSKYESAQTKLRDLSVASPDRYDDMRSDVRHAWNQLEAAIGTLSKQSERGEQ